MLKMKTLSIHLGIAILILLVGNFFLSILSFFNLLNGKLLEVSKLLIIFLSFFISSYRQGKLGTTKGFLEGMIIGFSLTFLLFIIHYGFYGKITLTTFFYYGILMILSILGGMIGVSKRKEIAQ